MSLLPIVFWVLILFFQAIFFDAANPFLWSDFPYQRWRNDHDIYICKLKNIKENIEAIIEGRALSQKLIVAAHSSYPQAMTQVLQALKAATWEPRQESYINAPFFIAIKPRSFSQEPYLKDHFQQLNLGIYALSFNAKNQKIQYIPRHQRFLLL